MYNEKVCSSFLYSQGGLFILLQKITLEAKPRIDEFFRAGYYEQSDCTFTNLYMWRKYFNTEWAVEGSNLFIKADDGSGEFFLPPFGKEADFAAGIMLIQDYFRERGLPFVIKGAVRSNVDALQRFNAQAFAITDDRDNADYVYESSNLIGLHGRRYHGKKNHINHFRKNNVFEYAPLSIELIKPCIDFEISWYEDRDENFDSLLKEKNGIIDALHNFEYLGFQGGVILVGGEVKAFSFGEMMNPDMAIIHVEKGAGDLQGIYPLINQQFCEHAWSDVRYINREEDMGLPGLRKSKESYFPDRMIDKYVIRLKDEV